MNGFDPGRDVTVEFANPDGFVDVVLTHIVSASDQGMLLADPDPGGPPLPFEPDAEVMARIDDATSITSTRVRLCERTPLGLLFGPPEEVQRFPKRRFFRIAVELPLLLGRIPSRVVDLSGNGLLALCPETLRITEGDLVDGRLELPERSLQVFLRAVRVTKQRPPGLAVGFEFDGLSEAEQDHIIAYLLDRQRVRMRILRR